jgi:hypothetical protein
MPDQLQIRDAQIIRSTDAIAGSRAPDIPAITHYRVLLTVENASAEPLFAVSTIADVSFDADSRLLHLGFEPGKDYTNPEVMVSHSRSPAFVEVAPNAQATLDAAIFSPITLSTSGPPARHGFVRVSLTDDVDVIEFSVSATNQRPPQGEDQGTPRERAAIPWQRATYRWTVSMPG